MYYKRKLTPPVEEEKETIKTYTQLKKELKKQKDAPVISKKEFRKGISSESIKVEEEQEIPTPSIMDVVIVQLPMCIYSKFTKSDKPKAE